MPSQLTSLSRSPAAAAGGSQKTTVITVVPWMSAWASMAIVSSPKWLCVCVCVCVREIEREEGRENKKRAEK